MKEKLKAVEEFLTEGGKLTPREMVLTVLTAFLFGLVLGMIFSPKKTSVIGSNNGSNNVGNFAGDEDDDDEDEDDD